MVPITFEEAVGYFGLWLFVLGVCCSFIVGLYYLADLVEEHFKTTKKVIHWTILGTLGVLLLLWLLEGVEPLTMLPSLGAQLGYWRVVARRFPFLSVRDPTLLGAGALTVWAHLAWMHYHLTTFHHLMWVRGGVRGGEGEHGRPRAADRSGGHPFIRTLPVLVTAPPS
ncbi:Protein SVP26 [Tetrabaena socialis]|uniref:Protein SVP26 n=1 Tax=Tetrabaena socialis TaxID=47790 RepID=A0A2J8AI44_9CHLO|nr:Protein SVP26 [Tetrabaena socialis]|eukprot:PNH12182.1 Protein SVP26 [Tetrabaena socialis]